MLPSADSTSGLDTAPLAGLAWYFHTMRQGSEFQKEAYVASSSPLASRSEGGRFSRRLGALACPRAARPGRVPATWSCL